MDSKIIALIAGSFLLTGCITGKVERLHTTTSQLSNEVDNYVSMMNRNIDLNHKADLKLKRKVLDLRLQDTIRGSNELYETDTLALNSVLAQLYYNKNNAELYKKQNKYISNYFKSLTNILEEKEIANNIEGLVKNVDVLNQVIEKNIKIEDELKGRLKPNETSIIESTLSNGFKIYQYHKFRKGVDNSYDVILEALYLQKLNIIIGNHGLFLDLNENAFTSRESLVSSYNKQISEAKKLVASENQQKIVYKEEDFKKLTELAHQPYMLQRVDTENQPTNVTSSYRSEAFRKLCPAPEIKKADNSLGAILPPLNTFDAKIEIKDPSQYKNTSQTFKYKFEIESFALKSAEIPVCELIDIVGLMKEKKYSQIETTSLKRGIENYNKILDFVDPDSQKKEEDK